MFSTNWLSTTVLTAAEAVFMVAAEPFTVTVSPTAPNCILKLRLSTSWTLMVRSVSAMFLKPCFLTSIR